MSGPDPAVEPPAVLVRRHGATDPAVLREVCAGAEEEGVPTRVQLSADELDAAALAHAAALDSRLEVGIGLDAAGRVAVHHGKLPMRRPAAVTEPGAGPPDWRRAGRTAARIVTGLPLT